MVACSLSRERKYLAFCLKTSGGAPTVTSEVLDSKAIHHLVCNVPSEQIYLFSVSFTLVGIVSCTDDDSTLVFDSGRVVGKPGSNGSGTCCLSEVRLREFVCWPKLLAGAARSGLVEGTSTQRNGRTMSPAMKTCKSEDIAASRS